MNNPIDAIRTELAHGLTAAKAELRRQIHIDLLREGVALSLSRLMTLDPDRADSYHAAITAIGE